MRVISAGDGAKPDFTMNLKFQFALMRVNSSRPVSPEYPVRFSEFQFALMRVSSSRNSFREIIEAICLFQFALMRVNSLRYKEAVQAGGFSHVSIRADASELRGAFLERGLLCRISLNSR